jgi:hypothetical protein
MKAGFSFYFLRGREEHLEIISSKYYQSPIKFYVSFIHKIPWFGYIKVNDKIS